MKLSRPRVLFRVVLLLVLAGLLFWRGWRLRAGAPALGGPEAAQQARFGLLWLLAGVVALLAAAAAALALRPPRPREPLNLK